MSRKSMGCGTGLILIVVVGMLVSYLTRRRTNSTPTPTSSQVAKTQKRPPADTRQSQKEHKKWQLIASFGWMKTVYMPSSSIKDRQVMSRMLNAVVNKNELKSAERGVQVMIFDDKKNTPQRLPMTDGQMLHWKAQYNFNPNTGLEKFVYIEITDERSSPPGFRQVEADIRP